MSDLHHISGVAALRDTVARIEAGRSGAPRRRAASGPPPVGLGDGALPLDAALGGGLRRGALHEVVAEDARDAAAAAGFALAAAGRCAGPAPLVWIVEDHAAAETGLPYRPGLAAHGIDPDRLILVRTGDGPATLWALEEALRLGAPAVLAELWSAKPYGLAPSRRLLLAAQNGRGAAILLHAGLAGRGAGLSSAAETRLAVAACPSPRLASAGSRVPIPGPPAVAVRVLKLRLGGEADLDRDRRHALVWNQHRRCFDAHALPVGVSAPAADGPRPARRSASVVAFGARAG
ncbi:ImuA family protein [Lichenibacterium dinghuense]|uniref:ImuA family protein n=1 Tax=Lichenibacterium dinghuense TaxID=2895977 RepID=UPI001F2877E3|nr:hypothetical protein [Lichenibacterium sp. 6Y81]